MAVKQLKGGKLFFGQKTNKRAFSLKQAKEKSLENLVSNNDGNISSLLNQLIEKVDKLGNNSFTNDKYIAQKINNKGAIEVDVKKNLFIAGYDKSDITIDSVSNKKVNNKVDKLRQLRRSKNGK